jgi:acyl-CoA reductase-like NAD-dependent aldehyde dehydrogenase
MLIGGELREARGGAPIDAYNPATGELFARFPRGGAADVDDAVAAAQSAFRAWWSTPPLDAVDGAMQGMNFTWQGQSCGSTSRLLVHHSVREQLVERLAQRMSAMRAGPPGEETTETGAIVHRRQYEKVLGYLDGAREEGLRLVTGGRPPEGPDFAAGLFLEPRRHRPVPAAWPACAPDPAQISLDGYHGSF